MPVYMKRMLNRLAGTLALASIGLVAVSGVSIGPLVTTATAGYSAAVARGQSQASPQILVLRVYFRDYAERDRLAIELDAAEVATTRGFLTVYADQATYNKLLRRGIRTEVDEEQTELAALQASIPNPFLGGYKTVEEIQAFLDQKVTAYPTLAEKIDIGDSWCKTHPGQCTQPNSWNGYDLWVLHITNRDIPGPKPAYWYDAGIHPIEIATPEVAMRFINWLLDGYNSNPDAHWLVDYHDIWVMPVLNPDGHHIVSAGGDFPYGQRKNADNDDGCTTFSYIGTDLNRNFPFLWGCCQGSSSSPCDNAYRGPSAASEDETQAVRNQVLQIIPDQRGPNNTDPAPITTTGVYQSMHSNAVRNLYSWGWTTQPSPNNADIRNIGAHMSALNAYGNGYLYCQPSNCLYRVDGATLDWSYGELGIPGFTTEISGMVLTPAFSCLDNPGCNSARGIWPENRGALVYQAKIARMPYLLTRGPDANVVTTAPMTVTQGTQSHLTSTINYAWTDNGYLQNVAAAEYYIDTPPWAGGIAIPMNPTDGSYNSPTEEVEAIVATGSLAVGRHILFVRGRGVNDYSGFQSWGPISATFLNVLALAGGSPTPTLTPCASCTNTPTNTPVPTNTGTPAPPTSTNTSVPTNTPINTTVSTSTSTATPCTISFSDVLPTDYFYEAVRYLYCHGAISGYGDGTFRPYNLTTRGQLTKIVSLAEGWATYTPPSPTFIDVPANHTFHTYIETAYHQGVISGYTCGAGCLEFRPGANVTRAQLSKIIVAAEEWTPYTPPSPTFHDVPANDPFYAYIETAYNHGIISGYTCGAGCLEFRPSANATRGQISKIVHLAVTAP